MSVCCSVLYHSNSFTKTSVIDPCFGYFCFRLSKLALDDCIKSQLWLFREKKLTTTGDHHDLYNYLTLIICFVVSKRCCGLSCPAFLISYVFFFLSLDLIYCIVKIARNIISNYTTQCIVI